MKENTRKIARFLLIMMAGSVVGMILVFFLADMPGRIKGASFWNKEYSQIISVSESYDAEEFSGVEVHLGLDDVTIYPVEGSEISLAYNGHIRSSTEEKEPYLIMDRQGDNLKIYRADRAMVGVGYYSRTAKLELGIPEDSLERLSISISSGDITLNGRPAAGLDLSTSSGDVSVTGFTGRSLRIESSSGKQILKGIEAQEPLNLTSNSGNITVEDIRSPGIQIVTSSGEAALLGIEGFLDHSSSSGDLHARFTLPGNTIKAESSSGAITVELPAETSFDFAFDTSSGRFESDFPSP